MPPKRNRVQYCLSEDFVEQAFQKWKEPDEWGAIILPDEDEVVWKKQDVFFTFKEHDKIVGNNTEFIKFHTHPLERHGEEAGTGFSCWDFLSGVRYRDWNQLVLTTQGKFLYMEIPDFSPEERYELVDTPTATYNFGERLKQSACRKLNIECPEDILGTRPEDIPPKHRRPEFFQAMQEESNRILEEYGVTPMEIKPPYCFDIVKQRGGSRL